MKSGGDGNDGTTPKNKGKMQADTTVADKYNQYPSENGILNESRKKCEKNKKSKETHRKMTRRLLERVNRDVKHIDRLLDAFEQRGDLFPLIHNQQRMLWIIRTAFRQQKMMYGKNVHSCQDRIASIYQPNMRPIPRGKLKLQIEFGSKLDVSPDQHI